MERVDSKGHLPVPTTRVSSELCPCLSQTDACSGLQVCSASSTASGRHPPGLHVSAHGAALPGLRQEVQAELCHLPGPPGLHGRGGAYNSILTTHTTLEHSDCASSWWTTRPSTTSAGATWTSSGPRHQPQPAHQPDRVLHHRPPCARRRLNVDLTEFQTNLVPYPASTLPAGHLRAHHLSGRRPTTSSCPWPRSPAPALSPTARW